MPAESTSRFKNTWVVFFNPDRPRERLTVPVGFSAASETGPFAQGISLYRSAAGISVQLARTQNITLVFDGRLDNGDSLARQLFVAPLHRGQEAGLLVYAYQHLGPSFAQKLRGAFSFLLWDAQKKIFLAGRDPLGAHPLFYSRHLGDWIFSNAIDALLACPQVSVELNRAALASTLAGLPLRPGETCYAWIWSVPPGSLLQLEEGESQTSPYWQPCPRGVPDEKMVLEDLEQLDGLLEQAVYQALDLGRAGIFLSGEMDSISLAALAALAARDRAMDSPAALSFTCPHPACNLADRQRAAAGALRLEGVLLPLEQAAGPDGLLQDALALSRTWPVPLATPWRPVDYRLAQAGIGLGCQVILTGRGGEDWLPGNPAHLAGLLRSGKLLPAYRLLQAIRRSSLLPRPSLLRTVLWPVGLRPLLAGAVDRTAGWLAPQSWRRYRLARARRSRPFPAWLAPDPELQRQLQARWEEQLENEVTPQQLPGNARPGGVSYTFSQPRLASIQEEDFEMGRQLGLPVIHPYWNAGLVEFLCRLPTRLLLSAGEKGLVEGIILRRFPGLGLEGQKKAQPELFFHELVMKEGRLAWYDLGGLRTLARLGVVAPQAASGQLLVDGWLGTGDPHGSFQLWEALNLEAWVQSHYHPY